MNGLKFEVKTKEELECLISAIDHALLPDKRVLNDIQQNLKDMVNSMHDIPKNIKNVVK